MGIVSLALTIAGSIIIITVGAGATDPVQDESRFKAAAGLPGTPTPTVPVPADAASLASLDSALASLAAHPGIKLAVDAVMAGHPLSLLDMVPTAIVRTGELSVPMNDGHYPVARARALIADAIGDNPGRLIFLARSDNGWIHIGIGYDTPRTRANEPAWTALYLVADPTVEKPILMIYSLWEATPLTVWRAQFEGNGAQVIALDPGLIKAEQEADAEAMRQLQESAAANAAAATRTAQAVGQKPPP